jgi:hypothetical protein
MTAVQILLILNLLSGRLFFDRGKFSNTKLILYRSIITLLLGILLFRLSEIIVFLIFSVIVILTDIFWLKENKGKKYTVFLIALFIIIPGFAQFLLAFMPYSNIFNPVSGWLFSIAINFPVFAHLDLKIGLLKFTLILTGYLFTIKESTIIIRGILDSIKAVPQKQRRKDEEEYNRGKYIGNLERTFIYFLIIFQQYTVIGILLGLKTFARFKELDNRDFAEYFLIGSMLSILAAILPAMYVVVQL